MIKQPNLQIVCNFGSRTKFTIFKRKMEEEKDDNQLWQQLKERMQGYPDEELITILKKRKHYRPEAAKLATEEAIRRGLIHSEQDLFSPKFETPPLKFSFFPYIDNETTRVRVIKSLSRSLMITGIIPIIWGIMKFPLQKYLEGASLLSLGLIWTGMAWLVMTRRERRFLSPLFVIALLSAIYAVRILLAFQQLRPMDILVPAVVYGIVFYALFYIRSLLKKTTEPGR